MEEKERFELNDNDCIIDNEKDVAICDICDVSESPKILVNLLNQQDKRIKELQEERDGNYENYSICWKENEQLKEQLAEKDKEIEQLKKFDDLNKTFFELFRTAFKEPDKVDDLFNTLKTIQEKHNQDKISFAVEQLEKVKEKILSYENVYYQFLESGAKVPVVCLENFRVKQTIDNQIKQLKEGK